MVALYQHLRSIELSHILATVVAGVEADAAHFKAFPARETLWHCICSSAVFHDFTGYADLFIKPTIELGTSVHTTELKRKG